MIWKIAIFYEKRIPSPNVIISISQWIASLQRQANVQLVCIINVIEKISIWKVLKQQNIFVFDQKHLKNNSTPSVYIYLFQWKIKIRRWSMSRFQRIWSKMTKQLTICLQAHSTTFQLMWKSSTERHIMLQVNDSLKCKWGSIERNRVKSAKWQILFFPVACFFFYVLQMQ